MISDELIEKFHAMSSDDKISDLDRILDMDLPPLDMVVAFYTIVKNQRAAALFARLHTHP